MRHNVSILLGKEMERFAPLLAKYIYKYGEGDIAEYHQTKSWVRDELGNVEIQKTERLEDEPDDFVSTTKNKYSCHLVDDKILKVENIEAQMQVYFTQLHQRTVTVNHPGDNNNLLLTIYLPLYDASSFQEVKDILKTLEEVRNGYEVLVVGLCNDLRRVLSSELVLDDYSLEEENSFMLQQEECLKQLAEIRQTDPNLKQIVILQNVNKAGFALNIDQDSLIRIIGEMSMLFVEKYGVIFHQNVLMDQEHPFCSLGLSVLNLDKYYFSNYLLRRSYLHMLQREQVDLETVPLNKVAVEANKRLDHHQHVYSNFYKEHILPLVQQEISHDQIVAQTADLLQEQLNKIDHDLTDYIAGDNMSLPEKQAMLAVIMGYDDPLLKGNLFNQNQLSLDSLDEEVANIFISENNKLVTKQITADGEDILKGPITDCCDANGYVKLPLEQLQKLRKHMRESTNYIRQKYGELEELEVMTQNAVQSEKRLTERGFEVDGNIYYIESTHEEVKFEEEYIPKKVTESSVDLRSGFTPIKDQGQVGACTVFSVTSIFEYILKKNAQKNPDLSEAFVYYNVRKAENKVDEDTGSSYQDVIRSIGTEGVCLEELHPYSKKINEEPSQVAYDDAKHRRIVKALNVEIKEDSIKSAIQDGLPVAISLKVFESFSSTVNSGQGSRVRSNGFVTNPTKEELASENYGYHAMVIVGYSDEHKYFVVRNSWGKAFGDKGYCYIPYSYICDNSLNRMACVITEVDVDSEQAKVIVGGRVGQKTMVHFNLSDSVVKSCIVKNLINEEEFCLKKMEEEYLHLRMDYTHLMETLGNSAKRNVILELAQGKLEQQIKDAESKQRCINEEERPTSLKAFRKKTWIARIKLVATCLLFVALWGWGFYVYQSSEKADLNIVTDFFSDAWAWISSTWGLLLTLVLVVSIILTILYWWWSGTKYRQLAMELEEKSAYEAHRVSAMKKTLEELPLKFQIAGMILDDLLKLRMSLDRKLQAMKSFIGNLKVWQEEEKRSVDDMESLVKEPFIPLLKNEVLDDFFDGKKEKITNTLRLYKFFENYDFNDEAIINFKRELKAKILLNIEEQLQDFTVLRHILGTKKYPYLDTEYASAESLLPILDQKSEIFCQVRTNINTAQEACFLFVNVDADYGSQWEKKYPHQFQTKPSSENIVSVYKISEVRLQLLNLAEV